MNESTKPPSPSAAQKPNPPSEVSMDVKSGQQTSLAKISGTTELGNLDDDTSTGDKEKANLLASQSFKCVSWSDTKGAVQFLDRVEQK